MYKNNQPRPQFFWGEQVYDKWVIHVALYCKLHHVYAENLLIYRLVKMKNIFSLHYPLVDDKLNKGTHSLVGFGRYIAKVIIDRYSYQCLNNPCLPCGRPMW